ncbi:MAG TPA: SDR family oxidoreductase, partial [Conexibacter sp.]
ANCVCPGAVDTAMLRASTQVAAEAAGRSLEDALRERAAATPLRRLQSADSIASAVLFLASDDARDVTGQAIEVDGGEFMP